MRISLTLLLLITACSTAAIAGEGNDTLRFYLEKSPLIVSGKLRTPITGIRWEAGVMNHVAEFEVTDVLHGDPKLKEKHLHVIIIRYERGPIDKHPLIDKDSECILFLKPNENMPGRWTTSDMWFGIQHLSPQLAESLKRLSAEKQKAAPTK